MIQDTATAAPTISPNSKITMPPVSHPTTLNGSYPASNLKQCQDKPDHNHHHNHHNHHHHHHRRHHPHNHGRHQHHHRNEQQQQQQNIQPRQHQSYHNPQQQQPNQLRRHQSFHNHHRPTNHHRPHRNHPGHHHHHHKHHHKHTVKTPRHTQRLHQNAFLRPRSASSPPLSRTGGGRIVPPPPNPILHVHAHGTVKRMRDGTPRGAYGIVAPAHLVIISEPLAGSLHTPHRASLAALHSSLELIHGLRARRAVIHLSDAKLARHFHSRLDAWAASGWKSDGENHFDDINEDDEDDEDELEDGEIVGEDEAMSMMSEISGLTGGGGMSEKGGRVKRDRRVWAAVLALRNTLHARGAVVWVRKSKIHSKGCHEARKLARVAALKRHSRCNTCGIWKPEGFVHSCAPGNISLAKQQGRKRRQQQNMLECWRDSCIGKNFSSVDELMTHVYQSHALKCQYDRCEFAALDMALLTKHVEEEHGQHHNHHHHGHVKGKVMGGDASGKFAVVKKKKKKKLKRKNRRKYEEEDVDEEGDSLMKCPHCKTFVANRNALGLHVRKSCRKAPSCPGCGRKFVSDDALASHLQRRGSKHAPTNGHESRHGPKGSVGRSLHGYGDVHEHRIDRGHLHAQHSHHHRHEEGRHELGRQRHKLRSRSRSRGHESESDTDSTYSSSSSSSSSYNPSSSSDNDDVGMGMGVRDHDRMALNAVVREFRGISNEGGFIYNGGAGGTGMASRAEEMREWMIPNDDGGNAPNGGDSVNLSASERQDRHSA